MALDVDAVIDRRRLTRRVALWRALAVLVVLGAIGGAFAVKGDLGGPHVARLAVTGAITSDRPLLQLIEKLRKDDSVAGVLVSIDSPGGTSVGGERLYNALREVDAVKPVVAHINTLGASAAYMTALASDHIVAQRTSLTGSIGVLIQFGQISEMLKSLGIEVRKVDSGPLKAEPNPFEPTDPAAIAVLQDVVNDTFDYFLGLVIERRNMPEAKARSLADGRIFTGGQALADGLVDEIGDEDAAVAWLVKEKGLRPDLPVRTYAPDRDSGLPLVSQMTNAVVDRIFATLGIAIPSNVPMGSVDGLWSIWQGSPSPEGKVFTK
ncbi:signal peptide peptidase SppA [Acuticoccus sp. MNP-M23]|uniref:signal peptide peptidase SppA n=1 Tax=Acuticoccus sp. MNP-M23 TaxID=3072793 RepID=UPI0028169D9A|nr:signal peptide peptidase SppA [Acuticoccus sp. MNP-M23]WMS44907.1 signal peptide peptidase SppA [Acuticoccus sp. MNP-M23]